MKNFGTDFGLFDPHRGAWRAATPLDRMQAKFPTAAIAVLELSGPWSKLAAGRARLASFVTPPEMHNMHSGARGRTR